MRRSAGIAFPRGEGGTAQAVTDEGCVHYDVQKGYVMAQSEKIRRYSQALRRNMTREERHLWYDFLKTYPVPIHRQYSFGEYIADFYCHKAKLIIELDGSQHCEPGKQQYDRKRTAYLEKEGLYVMRISNREVTGRFRAVCEAVDHAIRCRLSE